MHVLQLKPEIEISNFDNNIEEPSYLITYFNKNWKVMKVVYDVIFHLQSDKEIEYTVENLSQKGISVTESELNFIANFLKTNGLIVGYEPEEDKNKPLRNQMLWGRITIIPSVAIKKMRFLSFLFNTGIFTLSATMFLIWFIYMYLGNSPGLVGEQLINLSFLELIICYTFLIFTGFAHEFGHAIALMKHGESSGRIGVGVYFIMPVLFTDVTRVWRLSCKERVLVDLGGIYFQGLILLISFIINELFIHSHLLFFGIMLSTATIIANFNPFIKMDGYWIFSDILGVEDLHKLVKDILSFFFMKKVGLENPLNKFKKNQKIMLMVYILSVCLFFVYFMMMIFHSFILSINVLMNDLTILFSEEIFHVNINIRYIVSYLSSRFTIFLALFFVLRMLYILLKRTIALIKGSRR